MPPRTLESVPDPNGGRDPKPRQSATAGSPPTFRTPRTTTPSPRPTGLFGRLFSSVGGNRGGSDLRNAVTVESQRDPENQAETDAALRKRVEKQIRDSVGPRLRSYEVQVVDRRVTVRARAARFWQRRSLRHAIESLPALSGTGARVEVTD
jgi:hypothetical protein